MSNESLHSNENEMIQELLLKLESADILTRLYAAHDLAKFGNRVMLPILELLNSPNPITRGWSLIILNSIGDERIIEPVLYLLDDENADVRGHAVGVLGKFGNADLLPRLEFMVKNDTGYSEFATPIKEYAAEAIKEIIKRQKEIDDTKGQA